MTLNPFHGTCLFQCLLKTWGNFWVFYFRVSRKCFLCISGCLESVFMYFRVSRKCFLCISRCLESVFLCIQVSRKCFFMYFRVSRKRPKSWNDLKIFLTNMSAGCWHLCLFHNRAYFLTVDQHWLFQCSQEV